MLVMSKSLLVFILALSMPLTTFGAVQTGVSTAISGDKPPVTFVEIPAVKSEDDKTDINDNSTKPNVVSKTLVCRSSLDDSIVPFKIQAVSPSPTATDFKVLRLDGTCNLQRNIARAVAEISVPNPNRFKVFGFDVLNGVDRKILKSNKQCRVTDEVLTFWLSSDYSKINTICGKPQPDSIEDVADDSGPDSYGVGDNSGGYYGNEPQTQQPYNPSRPPLAPQQGYQPGQEQGYNYYDGYGDDWSDPYSDWQDSGSNDEWLYDNEFDNFTDVAFDDEFDNWGESDGDSGFSTSSSSNDTNNLEDVSSLFSGSNSEESKEFYYPDGGLITEGDPISQLFSGYTQPANSNNTQASKWGVLDESLSSVDFYTLYNLPTYESFKRYYGGNVSREEWSNWRAWVFSHNTSNNWDIDVNFDDSQSGQPQYAWYNPVRWWLDFSGWLTQASPFNAGNGKQYSI